MWNIVLLISCMLATSLLTCSDNTSEERSRRVRRYALQGSRWSVNEITYRISKYSKKLPKKSVDKVIKKALSLWEEVTNLKFVEQKQLRKDGKKVKIDISFETGEHGDDAPFDGEGGYRAHAFFPGFGGDLHLDDDEPWTLGNSKDGVRLLLVVTHEIGHALGLGHSDIPSALMAPSHAEWKGDVKLTKDDIKAVQGLYGKPGEGRPSKPDPALGKGPGPTVQDTRPQFTPGGQFPPRPGPHNPFVPPIFPRGPPHLDPPIGRPPHLDPPIGGPPHLDPNVFLQRDYPSVNVQQITPDLPGPDYTDYNYDNDYDTSIETDDIDVDDAVEIFTDNKFDTEPKRKSDPELCSGDSLDATVTIKNQTYVFKGDKYWKLSDSGSGVTSGYPRRINQDWENLPDNIDAAFTWKNGKTYMFKGSTYWRYSNSPFGKLDHGFPKKVAKGFGGIPRNVDAAFVWDHNQKIYFFKGKDYWKFDPSKNPPVEDTYPRPISNWKGMPDNIDAALKYKNGNTYFFKDRQYVRFNADSLSVDKESSPSYPRNTGIWWFGCYDDSPRRLQKKENSLQRFILD